jgi:hypothetical protein
VFAGVAAHATSVRRPSHPLGRYGLRRALSASSLVLEQTSEVRQFDRARTHHARQLVLARERGEGVRGIQMRTPRPPDPFAPRRARWAVNRGCDGASGFSVVRDPRFT